MLLDDHIRGTDVSSSSVSMPSAELSELLSPSPEPEIPVKHQNCNSFLSFEENILLKTGVKNN